MHRDDQGHEVLEMAELGAYFSHISALLSRPGEDPAPQRIVEVAARVMPHANHCGITLLRPDRPPTTVAASDDAVRETDSLQYRLGEGPCLDAARIVTDSVIVSDDLEDDERWPDFGPQCARQAGIWSMLSVHVMLAGSECAALNFYATARDAFDDTDVGIASIFAPFAAMALSNSLREQEASSLTRALGSSRQIGTAVGILMVRHGVQSAEAFSLLRTASQHLNRKLADIASEVTWSGELPLPDHRTGNPDPTALDPV